MFLQKLRLSRKLSTMETDAVIIRADIRYTFHRSLIYSHLKYLVAGRLLYFYK